MPTDASGNYSLPLGYLATTGTTIEASQHNPALEDLAAAMTGRLPRSGVAAMSGPLKLADGTAALPGLTFSSDPTTGFYRTAAGIFASIAGTSTGNLKFQLPIGLGPLPWSLDAAPPGWVLLYGQTLLRASYPDLWSLAQSQIAASNPFYNNGNGTTTFGVADMRGRVVAGIDNLGGVSASRLTNDYFGGTSTLIGGVGGSQSKLLSITELPAVTPAGTVPIVDPGHTHSLTANFAPDTGAGSSIRTSSGAITTTGISGGSANSSVTGITASFVGTPFGGGQAFSRVQPTLVANFILFAGA